MKIIIEVPRKFEIENAVARVRKCNEGVIMSEEASEYGSEKTVKNILGKPIVTIYDLENERGAVVGIALVSQFPAEDVLQALRKAVDQMSKNPEPAFVGIGFTKPEVTLELDRFMNKANLN